MKITIHDEKTTIRAKNIFNYSFYVKIQISSKEENSRIMVTKNGKAWEKMKRQMKKGILSCILTLAMVISLVPVSTKQAYASPLLTVSRKAYSSDLVLFANGNAIILKAGSNTNYTNIYIDVNRNGALDDGQTPIDLNGSDYFNGTLAGDTTTGFDLSQQEIYGGSQDNSVEGDTKITVLSGNIYIITGGGYSSNATSTANVTGNTNIDVTGGKVDIIFGGGYGTAANISGNTNITLKGGTIRLIRAGGIHSACVGGSTNVMVEGATITGNIYGGGMCADGSVIGGTVNASYITVNAGSTISGDIIGGGQGGGKILSSTNIIINGGSFGEYSEIYGGGSGADVGSSDAAAECNVTINGGSFSGGYFYGGGVGAKVYGNTHVTFNNGIIKNYGYVYGGGWGGSSGNADVMGNTSIDIGSGSFYCITGSGRCNNYDYSATVSGASITVSGGNVTNMYLGGVESTCQASSASATISGGTVTNIFKGYVSGSAQLSYTGGMITGVVDAELSKPVSFTGLTANGASGTSPTTELTLTFSEDPISLTASNITVTGATKGTLSGTGTIRTLNISDITVGNGENVTVKVASPAFTITPDSKTVAVYKYIPTLTDITINPTAVETSDRAVAGTKVADLAVTGTPTTGITYTLDGSGTHDSLFQIDGSELQIKSGTTLAAKSYTVKVKAREDAQPLNTVTKTISFAVSLQDTTPPTVASITRQTPSEENTNASSLTYRVTFSEIVSGVDTGDFTLTKTGKAAGDIAWVSSASGSTIDVTVNTVEGQGTLRLDLKPSGTGIKDTAGNAITGGFTEGQTYTIDRTAPTVTSIIRQTPSEENTNASSLIYRVTFSENVDGVDTGDFTLTTTLDATGYSIASVSSASGSVIDVTVNTGNDGTIRLDLKPSGTGIKDTAGNAITGGFTEGQTYTIDRTAPTLTAGAVSRTSDTSATVKFTSNEAGKYYYVVAASGSAQPTIDTSGAGANCAAAENTITMSTLSAGANEIYIVVKDTADNVSVDTFKISIPAYVAPPSDGGSDGSGGSSGGNNSGGNSGGGASSITGTVQKEQKREAGAPIADLQSSTEELKKIFTASELAKMEAGENAKVILKVNDISATVSEEEKKQIAEKLEKDAAVLYVDLSLYKQVGTAAETRVTETSEKIKISLEVPEELWSLSGDTNRTYRVIRIHNGVTDILEGTYDPVTHLFTFETDRFSTYALTYQDEKKATANGKPQVYNDFHHLRLTAKAAETSQTLSFTKVSGADGYLIYGASYGEKNKLKKLGEVSDTVLTFTHKKLKKASYYKYQVKAYQIVDGKKVILATSKEIYSVTKGKTYANPTKVTSEVSSVSIAVGKTTSVTCKAVLPKNTKMKKYAAAIRYETSNKNIATVDKSGKIKAQSKGVCYIYAYAQNGVYKKIKVTVK